MPSSIRHALNGDVFCLVALAAAGLGILAGGILRRLRPWRLWGPPAGYLLGSASLLAIANRLPPALTVAGLLAVAGAGGLLVSRHDRDERERQTSRRGSVLVLAFSLLAAGGVIFRDLGDPAQILQAWEPDVFSWLETEMIAPVSGVGALASRLVWQQGLLSSGGDSLFYGLPTFLLLSGFEASVLTLRVAAALLGFASLVLCWAVSRHFFGDDVASCAAVLWLLAPPFLVYGRYGTSVTAMWTALWLAVGAVFALLARTSATRAVLAALALYTATLQYAPGRIVVVPLLGLAAVSLPVTGGTRSDKARAALALAVLVAAALVVNVRSGRLNSFYNARGEQILTFRQQPEVFEGYFADPVGTKVLPWKEMPGFALRVARTNLRSIRDLVIPLTPLPRNGEEHGDPPRLPLLARTSLPLALWGLVTSFRRERGSAYRAAGLFAVFVLACLPLLLTNRVDVARAGCLLPFLVIWGACGGADLWNRLVQVAGWPVATTAVFLFLLGGAVSVASAVLPARSPRNPAGESLLAAISAGDTSFRLGVHAPRVQLGSAWLAAFDRLHRRGENVPTLLTPAQLDRLAATPESQPGVVDEVVGLSRVTPLLLGPSSDFAHLQPLLEARGLRVEEVGTKEFPLLEIRIDAPAPR